MYQKKKGWPVVISNYDSAWKKVMVVGCPIILRPRDHFQWLQHKKRIRKSCFHHLKSQNDTFLDHANVGRTNKSRILFFFSPLSPLCSLFFLSFCFYKEIRKTLYHGFACSGRKCPSDCIFFLLFSSIPFKTNLLICFCE